MNKKEIKSVDSDGKEKVVFVVSPNASAYRLAQNRANLVFSDGITNRAILKQKLDDYMKEQGLWDESKEGEIKKLQEKIEKNVNKLVDKKGKLTKEQGKKIAIEIRTLRFEQSRLIAQKNSLDEYTVEGQAETEKYDTLAMLCIRNEKGDQIFSNVEEYRDNKNEPYVEQADLYLSSIVYDIDPDWQKKLPENVFLKQFGFIDHDMRLIDKDGNYISADGKRVDKDGRFIDEDGNYVDEDGNPVDENGMAVLSFDHFKK